MSEHYLNQEFDVMPEEKKRLMFDELPARLARRQQHTRLTELLTDFDFLRLKLSLFELNAVIDDYELTTYEPLKLIQGALVLGNLPILQDTTQFASQLMGRLDASNSEVIRLRDQIVEHMATPWLCPLSPSLGTANKILKQTLSHESDKAVRTLALTTLGNDTYLASGGSDKTVHLWRISSGRATPFASLKSDMDLITDIIFTHQGDDLLAACYDGTIWVWDWQNKAVKAVISTPFAPINVLQISKDDRFLFVGSGSIDNSTPNVITLWDLPSQQLIQTFSGHRRRVNDLALLGKRMFSASGDGSIRRWDIKTGEEQFIYEPRRGSLEGGTFSRIIITPDGKHFATTSHDRAVWICKIKGGRAVDKFTGHGTPCTAIAFACQGHLFATASDDGLIQLWDLEQDVPPVQLIEHTDQVADILFSPDDRYLISGGHDGKIKIWDLSKLGSTEQNRHNDRVNTITITSDSLLAATGAGVNFIPNDISVKIWDVHTGQELHTLDAHQDYIHQAQFIPNRRILVSLGDDGRICLWSFAEQRLLREYRPYSAFCLSPDGFYIACMTQTRSKNIDIFALETGEQKAHFEDQVGAFAFATNSALISAGKDSCIQMRDINTGLTILEFDALPHARPAQTLHVTSDYLIGTFVFSDGKSHGRILNRFPFTSQDESIAVWDLKTGALLYTLKGMRADLSVLISPDSQSLFCVDLDNRIHQFGVSSGTRLKSWVTHQNFIEAWSGVTPHGYFVSVDEGGILKVWHQTGDIPTASYYADSRFTACHMTDDIIVAGEETGRLHFLKLKNGPF